jgi:DNA modification methylase
MREPERFGRCTATGTSIFDPVICELAYRWFCPPGGHILDPFAGGSVRGIVATYLDFKYTGMDLSGDQILANQEQALVITPNNHPTWIVGDSLNIRNMAPGIYDMVFSCPPYFDLEIYSDDPRDLSRMTFEGFLEVYRKIIKDSVSMLANNRFACWVVGEVRDKTTGRYVGLVPETIRAFEDAGMAYYNEIILVTAIGSLPVRVSGQFNSGRKVGKTHQNILVFFKGDHKEIKTIFGEIPS